MHRIMVVVATITLVFAVTSAVGSPAVQAQLIMDTSHLKLTSSAAHAGTHMDHVINNDIVVTIHATRNCVGHDETDWGTLTLSPSSTPDWNWNCSNCSIGYLDDDSVEVCSQAGGCQQDDVEYWLVGVQTAKANGAYCTSPNYPDDVTYFVDSDDLGNGKRYHPSPADCDTTVTPVEDAYSATDLQAGFDYYPRCSDQGVSIDLLYEE